MSLEEAAKGFLKLGVKMIIEYNLAPFYRPDDPLEVPEIPDREIIKQFLDDKEESRVTKADKVKSRNRFRMESKN